MHPTAMQNCQHFYDAYCKEMQRTDGSVKVVEIGSQNVNGSLREIFPGDFNYLGVDFVEGNGVEMVLTDPYSFPIPSESCDVVLSSSCFEHSEMFWLVFLEILRILKPGGLFYLNSPSNGTFHRFPVDCWRFYPDSGRALVTWAKRNGVNAALMESYISAQGEGFVGMWNDFCAVFIKDENYAHLYPNRILGARKVDLTNGFIFGSNEIFNYSELPEDMLRLNARP